MTSTTVAELERAYEQLADIALELDSIIRKARACVLSAEEERAIGDLTGRILGPGWRNIDGEPRYSSQWLNEPPVTVVPTYESKGAA